MESRQVSQVTTGVMVIVVGLLLLIVGLSRFASTDDQGRRGNGGWLLLVGALFLLNNFRILGLGDSWPLFIIGAGVAMMFGRGNRRARRAAAAASAAPTAADRPGDGGPQS